MNFSIRPAVYADIPTLTALIDASVRGLQAQDYSPSQIDYALAEVYGVDTQLLEDRTYFVVEADVENHVETSVARRLIVACGGWSKRKTLYGGDECAGRQDTLLNPLRDAAKIRAFFVHPDWVRRGIGTLILEACETAAYREGFTRLEMGATLTGVALYRARGYTEAEALGVSLSNGENLPIIRMEKRMC